MSPVYAKTYASLSTILCLILMFSECLSSSSGDQQATAYEMLREYDFPIGLLPKGVLGHDLDETTGKFHAFLSGTCSFSLERSYQIRYKSTVKGFISNGRLSSLEGISVKLFFMWVDIIEVLRNGDDLEFSIGIARAGFPIDDFEERPQCGCGLRCGDESKLKLSKFRSNPFA